MKKKLIQIALAVLCVLTVSLAAAGCTGGNRGKKYDYLVTFNYNVGTLQESPVEERYLGVKENSLIPLKPGDTNFPGTNIQGYYAASWHLPQTNADGTLKIGDDNRVLLGAAWDFATQRVEKDITLYAELKPYSRLIIKGGDNDVELRSENFTSGSAPRPDVLQPTKQGSTFYEYFEDEQCTIPFAWPYNFDEEVKIVYAKFIEGDWTMVRTAEEFNGALDAAEKKAIYLCNTIDFTGVEWKPNRAFGLEINGNGFAVQNIACNFDFSRASSRMLALFGSLNGANVHDITFENVTFRARIVNEQSRAYAVAAFATAMNEDTALSNVKITGSCTVTKNNVIYADPEICKVCVNEATLDPALFAGIDVTEFSVIQPE